MLGCYNRTVQETIQWLGTSLEKGLSASEAAQRKAQYGVNELLEEKKISLADVLCPVQGFHDPDLNSGSGAIWHHGRQGRHLYYTTHLLYYSLCC